MQLLPDIENIDSRKVISYLKWTIYNARRKMCANFKTATDNLNIAVYRYRNTLYLTDNETGRKLTAYQLLLAKRVYQLSHIDIFFRRCIVLDETTVDVEQTPSGMDVLFLASIF